MWGTTARGGGEEEEDVEEDDVSQASVPRRRDRSASVAALESSCLAAHRATSAARSTGRRAMVHFKSAFLDGGCEKELAGEGSDGPIMIFFFNFFSSRSYTSAMHESFSSTSSVCSIAAHVSVRKGAPRMCGITAYM